MICYLHLFQNFPQFVVIHIVKRFSVINEADVFLEFSCFFSDPTKAFRHSFFLHPCILNGYKEYSWKKLGLILRIIIIIIILSKMLTEVLAFDSKYPCVIPLTVSRIRNRKQLTHRHLKGVRCLDSATLISTSIKERVRREKHHFSLKCS